MSQHHTTSQQTLGLSKSTLDSNDAEVQPNTVADTEDENMGCCRQSKFAIVTFIIQALFLVFFVVFGEYNYGLDVENRWFYPMFQNVHVMIFIGFGFLMTFLKKYGYSAVSVTFLIGALVIQWHMIFKNILHMNSEKATISIGMLDLITADFTAAAVLISFGAVIGKTSPLQLMVMALLEVVVFCVNEMIAVKFQASDIGGSMVVHIFGAYFGLAVARVIKKPEHSESTNEAAIYHSDIFSMIGTVFLWLYWPSFNSAIATTEQQQVRAVINTYLALASCCLITFAVSSLTDSKSRFNMVHVQNATLAGGVAVGTAANFLIQPWGAVLIGFIAAIVSTLGFQYLQPALDRKIGLHDSCGVNNLHGMPGIIAAIVGIIAVAVINPASYGDELADVFPAMASDNSTGVMMMGRTGAEQAGYQAATLGVTLAMCIVGGLITGAVLRFMPGLDAPKNQDLYSDARFFEVAEGFQNDTDKAPSHESIEVNQNGDGKLHDADNSRL